MSTDSKNPKVPGAEHGSAPEDAEATSGKVSALGRLFAPHPVIWREARRMTVDKNVRVEDLAFCVSQDPVLVMEMLKAANAMYFSAGRPAITSTSTAIVRLGSEVVVQTLEGMLERPRIEDSEVSRSFEFHRNQCKRSAIIARMISEIVAKTLADDCSTAGLVMFTGHMLAAAHLGKDYVNLVEGNQPATIAYRLVENFKFDLEKMRIKYLQRQGMPESILFAVDPEGRPRSQDRAMMKPICFAAAEVIEAFDTNKWEKLSPGRQLPPKSSLRLLQIPEAQYLRFYERASEYLFSEKLALEKQNSAPIPTLEDSARELDATIADGPELAADDLELDNEIASLLSGIDEVQNPQAKAAIPSSGAPVSSGKITREDFNLGAGAIAPKTEARVQTPTMMIPPPPLRTQKGNAFVENVTSQLGNAKNGEELLRTILGILIDQGPFEKSALIVVSKDRSKAIVVAARGETITCGQTLILEDPLSPLAQCFSKVQSFGNKGSKASPWGSRAFALAPLDADHDTPVALYADCGVDGSITFEARRIFRAVVDILNQKLPTIPGGIPVEL